MTTKMLIEQDPHQTRVAILEDDRLAELYVERARGQGVVGNVYRGRVERVLPGMQAAFVDIGLERHAFLYVADVHDPNRAPDEDDDELPDEASDTTASIDELLRSGQEVVVQVVKDPLPNKGARVTTHVTLPGRCLVLMPTSQHRGLSRRIEDEDERERLRSIVEGLESEYGLIVRTAGESLPRSSFEADLEQLEIAWRGIEAAAASVRAPALVHRDLDVALRTVRDRFDKEYSVLWVDGDELYERVVEFLDRGRSELLERVRLYRQDRPLFERFGIESAIEEALRPKVWLKSGGYLVINPTEALVAIDVNTGKFVGRGGLDETIRATNLEAVKEIVRQIRLRDLGGIIVVDLIDMEDEAHRHEVFEALERELARDRSKNKVLSISEFGLVELTRKRSRSNLRRLLTQPCPHCDGRGRIKSPTTVALALRRELLRLGAADGARELLVRVHPEVARTLQGSARAILDELEGTMGLRVLLRSDESVHHERFDITEL